MSTNFIYRIGLGIAVVLMALLSAEPMLPPDAVPANAPAASFSAERAMADLAVVARKPHAAGSDAQAEVRNYIMKQIDLLGLQAAIEKSNTVSNILVRFTGTGSTKTVLITGHYDSHPPAPGAGDDGLSAVAMLEVIRVLSASAPLRNDVVFLFTDGEELGWLGAYAFLRAHPEARNEIGVVLCFDGRPGNGPLAIWETSPNDAWLVRQMVGLPLSLYAGSWTNRAERGERDTDFSIFSEAGFTGIEIENAESGTRYHTPRDTVEAISSDLVQSFGQAMITLVRKFGSIDLSSQNSNHDLAYFTLPWLGLVAFPVWLVPALTGLCLLALVALVVIARKQASFSFKGLIWSLAGLLTGIILCVACTQLIWIRVRSIHENELVATGGFEASTAWLTGLMFGTTILMIALLVILSRRLGATHVVPAAMILYLVAWIAVYFLMEADNPFTTAYVALPILGGVAGMAGLLLLKNPAWKFILLGISAMVALVLMVPQLWLATYTREDAWIPTLATCIQMGFFAPQVDAIFGKGLMLQDNKV